MFTTCLRPPSKCSDGLAGTLREAVCPPESGTSGILTAKLKTIFRSRRGQGDTRCSKGDTRCSKHLSESKNFTKTFTKSESLSFPLKTELFINLNTKSLEFVLHVSDRQSQKCSVVFSNERRSDVMPDIADPLPKIQFFPSILHSGLTCLPDFLGTANYFLLASMRLQYT